LQAAVIIGANNAYQKRLRDMAETSLAHSEAMHRQAAAAKLPALLDQPNWLGECRQLLLDSTQKVCYIITVIRRLMTYFYLNLYSSHSLNP
jgi:hypothetical protein